MTPDSSATPHIGVIRYRYIGDTLLSVPFLTRLRQAEPSARITLMTDPLCLQLMRHCPFVDEVLPFEPREFGFWGSVKQVAQARFTSAYVLKRSLSGALIPWLAKVRYRVGFQEQGAHWIHSQSKPYRGLETHESQCFNDLLPSKASSMPVHPSEALITQWLPESLTQWAQQTLNEAAYHEPTQWVVVVPTASNPAKCWPLEKYVQLTQWLLRQSPSIRVLLLGGPGDFAMHTRFLRQLTPDEQGRCVDMAGRCQLDQTAALMAQASGYIGNDSGLAHLAAAVGCPGVAMFGPHDPKQWAPLSDTLKVVSLATGDGPQLDCQPCRLKPMTCQGQIPCLTELTIEQVKTRLREQCRSFLPALTPAMATPSSANTPLN